MRRHHVSRCSMRGEAHQAPACAQAERRLRRAPQRLCAGARRSSAAAAPPASFIGPRWCREVAGPQVIACMRTGLAHQPSRLLRKSRARPTACDACAIVPFVPPQAVCTAQDSSLGPLLIILNSNTSFGSLRKLKSVHCALTACLNFRIACHL